MLKFIFVGLSEHMVESAHVELACLAEDKEFFYRSKVLGVSVLGMPFDSLSNHDAVINDVAHEILALWQISWKIKKFLRLFWWIWRRSLAANQESASQDVSFLLIAYGLRSESFESIWMFLGIKCDKWKQQFVTTSCEIKSYGKFPSYDFPVSPFLFCSGSVDVDWHEWIDKNNQSALCSAQLFLPL
jgi:hypothetical protein